MKFTEENLENMKYNKRTGKWYKGKHAYIYMKSCESCNKPYLTISYRKGRFCNTSCNNKTENHHLIGKKHSEKTKFKMSKAKKGKRRSRETKFKISKSLIGENHPNWKGGVSYEPYCFEFNSKEFKDFIKERDGWECLNPECSKNSNRLCIHHIDYNKKNCELNNLITLCNSCNVKANKDREWHEAWYNAIINKRI